MSSSSTMDGKGTAARDEAMANKISVSMSSWWKLVMAMNTAGANSASTMARMRMILMSTANGKRR